MRTALMTKLSNKLMEVGGKTLFKAKVNSPQILFGIGVVCVVGATVAAGFAVKHVDEIVDEHVNEATRIREAYANKKQMKNGEVYSKEMMQKDLALTYGQTGLKFARLFLPTAILLSTGIGCFAGAQYILRKRNLALLGAYAALEEKFGYYRERVREEYGEEKDYMYMNGLREEEVAKKVTDEKGHTKTVKEKVLVQDDVATSPYAKFFDSASRYWKKGNPDANLLFLKSLEDETNRKFKARAKRGNGAVFLNEIYNDMDLPQTPTGAICGWIWDDSLTDEENRISFGLFDGARESVRRFVNGYEDSILIDFNCQGKIWDKI